MRIESSDGVELALDVSGHGEDVLFVHGFSNDRAVWQGVQDALLPVPGHDGPGASSRSIRLDLRGHGDSDWSLDRRYAPSDHADDLACVTRALGLERFFVVAHSLGGSAATLFAAEHPDVVAGLVLVDTGPSLSQAAWARAAQDVADVPSCFDDVADYRRMLDFAYPLGRPEVLDRMARSGLVRRADGRWETKLDPALLTLTPTASEQRQHEDSLWAALGKIQCPTLVVRGERSAMFGEDVARAMVEDVLLDARRVEVPAAGHAVAVDNPSELGNAIRQFLAEAA